MEQMAKEQDKETDKNIIMAETEGHRKQVSRWEASEDLMCSFHSVLVHVACMFTAKFVFANLYQ